MVKNELPVWAGVLGWLGVVFMILVLASVIVTAVWAVQDRRRALRYGVNPSLRRRRNRV